MLKAIITASKKVFCSAERTQAEPNEADLENGTYKFSCSRCKRANRVDIMKPEEISRALTGAEEHAAPVKEQPGPEDLPFLGMPLTPRPGEAKTAHELERERLRAVLPKLQIPKTVRFEPIRKLDVPALSASASGPSSSAPGPSSSAPGPSGSAPGPSSSAPGPSSSAPGPSGSAPGPSSSAPGPSTSVLGPSASAPGPSTSAPGPSSSVPVPSNSALKHVVSTQEQPVPAPRRALPASERPLPAPKRRVPAPEATVNVTRPIAEPTRIRRAGEGVGSPKIRFMPKFRNRRAAYEAPASQVDTSRVQRNTSSTQPGPSRRKTKAIKSRGMLVATQITSTQPGPSQPGPSQPGPSQPGPSQLSTVPTRPRSPIVTVNIPGPAKPNRRRGPYSSTVLRQ